MPSILIIVFLAICFGFFLIFLLALAEKRQKSKNPSPETQISQEHFEKSCVLIVEGMKLEIEGIERSEDHQIDIIAKDPKPITGNRFLISCLYLPSQTVVGSAEILECSNHVVQDRLSKGIFITTGSFSTDIASLSELAPMELIDGKRFKELIKEYAPEYARTIRD